MTHQLKYYLYTALIVIITGVAKGQEINTQNDVIENIVESYSEIFDESTDLTPLLEDLERYLETPININTATRNDLERLHFLTSFQIENILNYRQSVGQIYSQYELLAIDGLKQQTADILTAFVRFDDAETEKKTFTSQQIHFRYGQYIEKQAGFIENDEGKKAYAGIPQNLLFKYRIETTNQFEAGITANNKSGEEFFTGSNPYGFDFYSGYIGFSGKKILKKVYVGDYQVKIAQGLTMWSGYGKRKSSEGVNIRPVGQGLKPYSSTDRNNFLRGIGTQLQWKNVDILLYYSFNMIDATVADTASNGKLLEVSALRTAGYHRTENEIQNRRTLQVQTAGIRAKYTHKRLAVGINSTYKLFNAPLVPSQQIYNRYYFSGNENYNISTDFAWFFNRINFFGEAAISKSKGKALIAGFESQPANTIAISMLYRNYAKDFHTISGTSFGEWSNTQNEKGLYTGISVFPISHVKISGYIDNYRSYWPRFNSGGPVSGTDYMLQSDYSPTRKLQFYVRGKYETNDEGSSSSSTIKHDTTREIYRIRFNSKIKINDMWALQARVEWSDYKKDTIHDKGILCFADVIFAPNTKFKASGRIAWHNTDSYNSRIYAYENDVLHYFYIPAFYSNGMRYYLNLSYQITSNLKMYFKLAQSAYFDDDFTIGSGNTTIDGNIRSDVKVHLKYRF
jgi:hypothetical protein